MQRVLDAAPSQEEQEWSGLPVTPPPLLGAASGHPSVTSGNDPQALWYFVFFPLTPAVAVLGAGPAATGPAGSRRHWVTRQRDRNLQVKVVGLRRARWSLRDLARGVGVLNDGVLGGRSLRVLGFIAARNEGLSQVG